MKIIPLIVHKTYEWSNYFHNSKNKNMAKGAFCPIPCFHCCSVISLDFPTAEFALRDQQFDGLDEASNGSHKNP